MVMYVVLALLSAGLAPAAVREEAGASGDTPRRVPPTLQPTKSPALTTASGTGPLLPSCAGARLHPKASDYAYARQSGNGPNNVGRGEIVGAGSFHLDSDGDTVGCD